MQAKQSPPEELIKPSAALADSSPLPAGKTDTSLIEPLSERELEVLQLVALGLSNAEIGVRLVISLSTVKGHTANIYSKLGVNSRTQAVARARQMGIL
jgi:LuxR family transcriptional regulator, maltose regulon positive regulatory protein